MTCSVNPREETRNANSNFPVGVYQSPGVLADHLSVSRLSGCVVLGLLASESPVLSVMTADSWDPPQSLLIRVFVVGVWEICILNKHYRGDLCSLKFANLYLPFSKVYKVDR